MIKLAAKLKVEGNTWAVIATRIGRKGDESARRITQEHPAEWKEAYEQAYQDNIDAFEAEGILTQRQLMRLGLDKPEGPTIEEQRVRQSAGHSALNHTRGLRAMHINLHSDVDIDRKTIIRFVLPGDNGKNADSRGGAPDRFKATGIPPV